MSGTQTETEAKPFSRMSRRWITILGIMLGINGMTVALALGERARTQRSGEAAKATDLSAADEDQAMPSEVGSDVPTQVAETSTAVTTSNPASENTHKTVDVAQPTDTVPVTDP